MVIGHVPQGLRQVPLGHIVVGIVVGIAIGRGLAAAGAVGVYVLQVPGHLAHPPLLNVAHGGVDGVVGGVGLGRRGQQDGGLCQRQPPLRQAQLSGGVHAGLGNGHGLGISQTHILGGHDQ